MHVTTFILQGQLFLLLPFICGFCSLFFVQKSVHIQMQEQRDSKMEIEYVYQSLFKPLLAKHETEIDKNLIDVKLKVGEIAIAYWRRAATYEQAKFLQVLQYVSSQSASQPD